MEDCYETLGPVMKARLDKVEMDLARVRDYIAIMTDTESGYQHARVLCLLLGLAAPRPSINMSLDMSERHLSDGSNGHRQALAGRWSKADRPLWESYRAGHDAKGVPGVSTDGGGVTLNARRKYPFHAGQCTVSND